MDIKILDSWLREHLETKAKPKDIAKALSLTSASVEKIEEFNKDYLYHVEVTTNRVDMMSVIGIAREAAAVLPQFGFDAKFINQSVETQHIASLPKDKQTIDIKNNDKLVKRICCVVLEVTQKDSPQYIKDRLEAAGIRSLNNLIDVTNYVMLEIGHPAHAFDYDRLITKKLIIREAKKGEKVITLDKKEHTLRGGDIVADNGKGEIIDLLGVMGTLNSVVTNETKRVLFFLDNCDPVQIRKTSMSLGIRTEAASINEKDVDPELMIPAIKRGIELYKEIAEAKIVSDIVDIYPYKWKAKTISVSEEKINQIIGVKIPLGEAKAMLERLDFTVSSPPRRGPRSGGVGKDIEEYAELHVTIPSYRDADMHIAEDIIEEIARMYGYHHLPSQLPTSSAIIPHHYTNSFFWEKRVKEALKYWGFIEVYTYSMVSKQLLKKEDITQTVRLKNPLDEDHVYMRRTLVPSLLEVLKENKNREAVKIFELANVYYKKTKTLPEEILTLAGVLKNSTFFQTKGVIEQIASDLGIQNLIFKDLEKGGIGASIYVHKHFLGAIQMLEDNLATFEINFTVLQQYATLKKVYTPIAKYPPIIEDISVSVDTAIKTGNIIEEIKKQSPLIVEVSLLDQFEDKRTFHILYQDKGRNLTNEEVAKIREKIISTLEKKFSTKIG
ncbi:MAG TPA: phenylalanine--tRNA ligase subunit beta [Candidatus Saccharimonadales bacterium]|nr:phenylalanine--tRNA ligase subunit beta [Candidatus Saccharimonadales bacterium]